MAVVAGDEGRHERGTERQWSEAWYFDFAAADASVGGYVRLGILPNLGTTWYWAALVGQGRRLVLVRDHDIELPRGPGLEVRGQGLWSAVTCETALDHWSIGLEAFAVALDDPVEAYRSERGDVVGLGFDLEWEARADACAIGDGHYEQSCQVHGEILVGDERLAFEGSGQRVHSWGLEDWWNQPRAWAAGLLSDGTSFAATSGRGARGGRGWRATQRSPVAVADLELSAVLDPTGLAAAVAVAMGDLTLGAAPTAHAPLLLVAPDGRRSRLARALCRFRADDGRDGVGWVEVLQPPAEGTFC